MLSSSVPVYSGPFGAPQAERLLWRAGFGPKPGDIDRVAGMGASPAVDALLAAPGKLVGPAPRIGRPLAPADQWGHDHLWWLDRMVRSQAQLRERMTLVWHDWFATSNAGVGKQSQMLQQNALFRRLAFGSFHDLFLQVTKDPAMLIWLNGTQNNRWSPNENYGREMMELFSLGADRGAYSERDVREQARALTGWRNDWNSERGNHNFRFDASYHDAGTKTIFGKRGNFNWQDSVRLCVQHPKHPSFFVQKLWGYFIPTPPPAGTQRALERLYVKSGHQVQPVLRAILLHPDFHEGERMTKPPAVLQAGMMRAQNVGLTTDAWSWVGETSGQQLFYPPNVAGWDDTRWLDTATFRGRWSAVSYSVQKVQLDPAKTKGALPLDAGALLDQALEFWSKPTLTATTRQQLLSMGQAMLATADEQWKRATYPALVLNALRILVSLSPDYQTS